VSWRDGSGGYCSEGAVTRTLCRLIASLPARVAMAARNLQAVLSQLGDLMSKAAFALRSTGEGLLSEEDVIRVRT
jgi:hypothetical protein